MKAQSKVGAFLKRAFDTKTDKRALRIVAAEEEAVGPRLEHLVKRGWRVLHSISVGVGNSDIDRRLIGPGGVFTIDTKNHPGGKVWVGEHAIRFNGQPTQYLRNSRHEGQRVQKAPLQHLGEDIAVRPVLVFLRHRAAPGDRQADASRRARAGPDGRAGGLQARPRAAHVGCGRAGLPGRPAVHSVA